MVKGKKTSWCFLLPCNEFSATKTSMSGLAAGTALEAMPTSQVPPSTSSRHSQPRAWPNRYGRGWMRATWEKGKVNERNKYTYVCMYEVMARSRLTVCKYPQTTPKLNSENNSWCGIFLEVIWVRKWIL